MTDSELVALAAKAAGMEHSISPFGDVFTPSYESPDGVLWDPLSNDSESLRVAVKLGMLFPYALERFEMFQRFYLEELDKDLKPSEAARRAIVRAAAEIGKNA